MDVDRICGSYDGRWSRQVACSLSEEDTVSYRNAVRSQRRQSLRNRGNRGLTIATKMRQHPNNEMTKPLKMWLYEHQDYPYPSKTEKLILASGSQMTLTQVSNWFANARRRLKNSLGQSGISWSRRVKLYNTHSGGDSKVELSISSEEGIDTGADFDQIISKNEELADLTRGLTVNAFNKSGSEEGALLDCGRLLPPSPVKDSFMEGCGFPVHKYKHGILQRYLNDSVQHAQMVASQRLHLVTNGERESLILARSKVNSFSGSTSSHDMERMSPVPSEADTVKLDGEVTEDVESLDGSDTRWLELDAALALTNLARARSGQALCL